MLLLGQFIDLDRPDMFVWLRGFSDMTSRRTALETFYGGPVWAPHRETANAMMLDSDDVLLLKPADNARLARVASCSGSCCRACARYVPAAADQ